jgi:hypothetical protein
MIVSTWLTTRKHYASLNMQVAALQKGSRITLSRRSFPQVRHEKKDPVAILRQKLLQVATRCGIRHVNQLPQHWRGPRHRHDATLPSALSYSQNLSISFFNPGGM